MSWVIAPGYEDSRPTHWQSLWQQAWGSDAVRIQVPDWGRPDLAVWTAALREVTRPDDVVVAHSMGCPTTVAALLGLDGGAPMRCRAAFLVCPPDLRAPSLPDGVTGFQAVAAGLEAPLPVPAQVVGSTDDPYCQLDVTRRMARAWQAPLHVMEDRGHINQDSGLADWPLGQALLDGLVARSR